MRGKIGSAVCLIEIIVDICLFAISCAIIVQIFSLSVTKATKSRDLTFAIIEAQSIAEKIKASPGEFMTSDTAAFYFDNNYAATGKENAFYTATVELKKEPEPVGVMILYDIDVKRTGESIFTLSSQKYFSGGV